MPFDLIPLSALSLEALADICRQDDHPQVAEARDLYEERRGAVEAAIERRAETFGTPEWCARYDAEKRALAEWR